MRREFWELAFEKNTQTEITRVSNALIRDCRSADRVALRTILLGVLHGPVMKGAPSYLSNEDVPEPMRLRTTARGEVMA